MREPNALVYFNQASPSAYVRGNLRAVPMGLSFLQSLEMRGALVLNGFRAFTLELSKASQASLLKQLGIRTPRTFAFNDFASLKKSAPDFPFPALIKPEQGGSGARIHRLDSFDALESLLASNPSLWEPDQLLLLQEYFSHDVGGGPPAGDLCPPS